MVLGHDALGLVAAVTQRGVLSTCQKPGSWIRFPLNINNFWLNVSVLYYLVVLQLAQLSSGWKKLLFVVVHKQ